MRTPNFHVSDLPSLYRVTIPIRAFISCTVKSAMNEGISVQSSLTPNNAPATEHVVISTASLSTLPVIIPGPRYSRRL